MLVCGIVAGLCPGDGFLDGRPSRAFFGCLGNHEIYTETEDSITRLFATVGIRILRQERALIQSRGEVLNLIGVDYQQLRFSRDHG